MPRIRTLKPEHRQHRKVGQLDHVTYRLWVGMILEADDEGRLVYDPEALRVLIFGYHVKVTRALVEASTNRLDDLGLVCRYAVEGQEYVSFPSWHDHQKIDRKRPSLLPPCDTSSSVRRAFVERSSLIGRDLEGKGSEGKGVEHDTPPSAASLTPRPNGPAFTIPPSILHALTRAPRLNAVASLHAPAWWQAAIRANPGVDLGREVLKAEAYLVAHPEKHYRKLSNFLHGWIGRADRET